MSNTVCECNTTCWHGRGCNIECSNHGECDNNWMCHCDYMAGWSGTYCEIPGCPRVSVDDPECSNHGDCNSQLHECECYAGWSGAACHIPDCPGNPDCNLRGYCNDSTNPPRCTNCSVDWMGSACDEPCLHGSQIPMDSGNCMCEPGWTGTGCNSECSENGVIVNKSCICDYDTGWKGSLCNIPGCPGLFFLDCSGRGEYHFIITYTIIE